MRPRRSVNIYPIRGGGGTQRHVRIDPLYLHDSEHEPKLTLRGYLPIPSLVLDVDEKPPLRAATSKMLAAASPRRRNAVLSPRVERPQVLSSGSEDWSGVSAGDPSVPAQTPSQPPRAASSSSRLNSKCRLCPDTSSTLNSICREAGRKGQTLGLLSSDPQGPRSPRQRPPRGISLEWQPEAQENWLSHCKGSEATPMGHPWETPSQGGTDALTLGSVRPYWHEPQPVPVRGTVSAVAETGSVLQV